MESKHLLKISEISRMAGINTRTLHYYDEIGSFSPEITGENGYRYYTLQQGVDLGLILSLKELDLPLKEIKALLSSNVQDSKDILEEKKVEVDEKIERLNDIKKVIEQKLHFIELAEKQIMQISFIELDEEYLLLSEKMEQSDSAAQIKTGYNLFMAKGEYLFANNDYGAMFYHDKTNTEAYDYFYLKTSIKDEYVYIKPSGRYLRFVHKGDDASLRNTYIKLKEYAEKNNLKFEGYFYERAFNETIQSNLSEYITEIQVKVK